jgi:diaminopimelate decarboxylase
MIAANAGVLLARVIRIQERTTRPILVLDAGMNDLIRPAIYDAYHGIKPLVETTGGEQAYDVVGPICETGDTFARNRTLPPLAAGDLVAFMTAGAYGAVMASTYNARDLVPEVLVSGDKLQIVRRRWTLQEQLSLERLPDWLEGS